MPPSAVPTSVLYQRAAEPARSYGAATCSPPSRRRARRIAPHHQPCGPRWSGTAARGNPPPVAVKLPDTCGQGGPGLPNRLDSYVNTSGDDDDSNPNTDEPLRLRQSSAPERPRRHWAEVTIRMDRSAAKGRKRNGARSLQRRIRRPGSALQHHGRLWGGAWPNKRIDAAPSMSDVAGLS